MNNKLMKLTAIILMMFMLPLFSAFAETPPETDDSLQQTTPDSGDNQQTTTPESSEPDDDQSSEAPVVSTPADHRDTIIAYYDATTTLSSWWDVVALYGAGADLSAYTLPEWTTESLGETATVTDYAGVIFGLIASGQNVHEIWGRDIADELAKKIDTETGLFGSYPNQQIYSILALDAAKEPYDRAAAINGLLTFVTTDGAFGYDVSTPDIDLTAMALLLLDEEEHADIIDSSLDYLASSQLENGGYSSWGIENSNSLEAVISVLATLNLLEDERFIKNERSLSDVLSDYILDSGMLAWEAGTTDENLLATQQGLIAYGDMIAGKSVFLRLASEEVCVTLNANVRIEGSAENVLNVPVTVKGYDLNLLDAIITALDENEVPYIIESSDYGAYIESISSETAGKFGGWDGWLVVLNGQSISSSADATPLTEGDQILVYYGMFAPDTLIPEYTLSATSYTKGKSFTITVTGTYFDYTTSQQVTVPVEGATIEIGDSKFTTNSEGIATVTPSAKGTQTVKIYKDNDNSYPSIVRIVPFTIDVAAAQSSSRPHSSSGGGSSYVPTVKDEDEEKAPATDTKADPDSADTEDKKDEASPEVELTYGDKDKISHWAVDGIKKAVQAGLFKGDEKGNINPQGNLSRAELATILLRLTDSPETAITETQFYDVNPDDWFYKAVCTAFDLGFMNGTGETVFAPHDSVTREQAAVVLARVLKLSATDDSEYGDSDKISVWAIDSVSALTQAGIMEGSDGNFNPQDILTREMCAVIMARALDYIAE